MRFLVTGGLGFLGANFIHLIAERGATVMNVDLDTYAGDERRLAGLVESELERLDIASDEFVELAGRAGADVIVHFAAESHVTRSESASENFYRTNVDGTRRVFEAALASKPRLVVHVSTDEIYGPCEGDPFTEEDKAPGEGLATSPYARSKALADDVARSYSDRLPVVVVRPTNCFGPWQHPEKAIPRWITRALTGRRLPVWGDGMQVRDWMHVDDACQGISVLIERALPGVYNLAPEGSQRTNLEIARAVARAAGRPESEVYLTEYDRPQHDRRYAIDASKVRALGWAPSLDLERQIAETVRWYADNEWWWSTLVDEAEALYEDERERASLA